jgi:hypothetical protein
MVCASFHISRSVDLPNNKWFKVKHENVYSNTTYFGCKALNNAIQVPAIANELLKFKHLVR